MGKSIRTAATAARAATARAPARQAGAAKAVATAGEGPSLRSWLSLLEAHGQLRHIKAEVDWDQEIAAIARVNLGLGGPGLLFEAIKGYRDGRCTRFLTTSLGNRTQVCLLAGIDPDTSDRGIVRHFKDVYRRGVPPVTVRTGPVKDNILRGDEIDLFEFPVPKWHHLDGGRFIDTFCGVITKDPETGQTNVGLYRGQLIGPRQIGKLLIPAQHWGAHFAKHRGAMQPMPVAIVHGWHDVLPFCAGSPFPKAINEYDMMGAILGRPVELVRCETIDLMVPASAELVVEGTISPDPKTFQSEGPFAEYPGYAGGVPSPKPVLEVSCVTHRNDPILRGTLEGARPGFPSEDSTLCAYSWSAIAWNMLEDVGVGGVTDVWLPPVSTGTNIVVQIQKRYRGQKYGTGCWTRVLIDATRNWEFEPNPDWGGRRYPPVNTLPSELEERIRSRWTEYGIGIDYLDDAQRELLTFRELSKRLPEI